jgi:phosphomannomutase/phosphoglucomutase
MSGHIFFNDNWYGFDDGIFSALRLLEIIGKLDTTSSEAFKKFPQLFNTPELAIKTTDKDKFKIIEKLKNNYDFDGYERILIDGLRLENKNAWGLARASNTTPTIVLRFEGDTEESLKEIIETFQKALFDIDKRLIINLN